MNKQTILELQEKLKTYLRRRKFNPNKIDTIVSTPVVIKGDLLYDGQVLFNGIIEGNLLVQPNAQSKINSVTVSSTGLVTGNVSGDYVIIEGRVFGDVISAENLCIRAGASVSGTISYRMIKIEEGAVITGFLQKLPLD
jgi:cytoskeletal protein CcmA (bactofilin family)